MASAWEAESAARSDWAEAVIHHLGIAGTQRASLMCFGFRQMHAVRPDAARQSGVVRNQQNQAAPAHDGAHGKGALGALSGIAGAYDHQTCRRQGAGCGAGIRQAHIVGH